MNLDERIVDLNLRLGEAAQKERSLGTQAHWVSTFMMAIGLLSSAVAGIAGIGFKIDGRIVGGLALVPGIIGLFGNHFKPQKRADWHYRKKDGLETLKRRLRYELPIQPSADNVASIANDWTKLDETMNREWAKEFMLSWSDFGRSHSRRRP